MVGVPKADRRKVLEWTNKMIAFDDPEYGGAAPEVGQMAAAELFMYANELAEEREQRPKDDLVSLLMQAEVDGERLTDKEFQWFFLLLVNAGRRVQPMGKNFIAVLLIAVGLVGLLYGGFSYTKQTTGVKLGPIELRVQERETINIPLIISVGAIAVGVFLLVAVGRK